MVSWVVIASILAHAIGGALVHPVVLGVHHLVVHWVLLLHGVAIGRNTVAVLGRFGLLIVGLICLLLLVRSVSVLTVHINIDFVSWWLILIKVALRCRIESTVTGLGLVVIL